MRRPGLPVVTVSLCRAWRLLLGVALASSCARAHPGAGPPSPLPSPSPSPSRGASQGASATPPIGLSSSPTPRLDGPPRQAEVQADRGTLIALLYSSNLQGEYE